MLTGHIPFGKGYNANSLYLNCLGEKKFVGKPVVYTSQSCNCKHTTTLWQKLASMWVDWMIMTDFRGEDVTVVEKSMSIELTKIESVEYRDKLIASNILLQHCGAITRIMMHAEFRVNREIYCLDVVRYVRV